MSRNQKPAIDWSPSLEGLDQLCGCDERLDTMVALFPSPAHARIALEKYASRGVIDVYESETKRRIETHELRGILEGEWAPAPGEFMVGLTDKGADAFENGDVGLLK